MRKNKHKEQTTLRDDFQRLQEAHGGVPGQGNSSANTYELFFPGTFLFSWVLLLGELDAYCHILVGRVFWKRCNINMKLLG